jgi:diguanylate cyclase (GGDEF)-like protein/PAS domain S-box-containing protein
VNGEPQHPAPDHIARGSFEALFDRAPFGYLITDADDLIVRANETFAGWTGFGAEDLVGRHFRDLLPPGSQLLYETRHLPVLRLQGSVDEVFLEVRTASGPVLPVLVNAVVDDGEVRIGVLAAANRVSYEQQLLATQRTAESLAARITVLQDASAAFAGGTSEGAIAQSLAGILEETLVASDACVALIGPTGSLEVVAGSNPLDGLIRDDRQVLGLTVVKSEKPVVVNATDGDTSLYPGVVQALRDARLQTVAVFPMMSDARPIGVAAAFFRRQRELGESETEVVLALSRQASQVLTRLRAQEQLAYAALHDQLTGLANRESIRRSITVALAARVSAMPGSANTVSVMFLDLDGFKTVNDRLGHHVGDAILQQVAVRLRTAIRAGDLVGRYGGDEFVVVCDATGDAAEAVGVRIRDEIRAGFAEAEGFAISASIGIAVCDATTDITTDAVIGAADAAMYESKRLGRDRTTRVEL